MEFKNGDKIIVNSKNSAYKGKHNGKTGVVEKYENNRSNVTVRLDNCINEASSYGLFYFNKTSITKVTVLENKANDYSFNPNNFDFSFQKLTPIPIVCNNNNLWEFIIFKDEEENNNMKTEKIVALWYKNEDRRLDIMYDKMYCEICDNDKNYQEVEVQKKSILEILQRQHHEFAVLNRASIEIEAYCKTSNVPQTEDTKIALQSWKTNRDNDYNILNSKKEEVEAMLSACETYEQEILILKTYKILHENGTLIKD